jgi:hypothetical protein
MRGSRALAAAAAFVLLASGCEYWDNLTGGKTLTRAPLEIAVIDAWTGEALPDAQCRDAERGPLPSPDDGGAIRMDTARTGAYAIRCSHAWYYDGAADISLTKAGTRATVRLARRGGADWYPDEGDLVSIPLPEGSRLRYPIGLDWMAAPADTGGHFRYEWTFLRASRLDRGHQSGNEPLPKEAYSPHFIARADSAAGVDPGRDTVILRVYSLLDASVGPYEIGSDTVAFDWIRNAGPAVSILNKGSLVSFKVGCGNDPTARINLEASDPEGECRTIRVWSRDAPSLPGFDTTFACGAARHYLVAKLARPAGIGRLRPEGGEEFDNLIVAEATDGNGETARDSAGFLTQTNAPPAAEAALVDGKPSYTVGDTIRFRLSARDTDGYFRELAFRWSGNAGHAGDSDFFYPNDNPRKSSSDFLAAFVSKAADTYTITASATDNCEDTARPEPIVVIVKNP